MSQQFASHALEQIRISLLVREGKKIARYRDEFPLRLYTAAQLKSLIASVPEWSIAAVLRLLVRVGLALEVDQ